MTDAGLRSVLVLSDLSLRLLEPFLRGLLVCQCKKLRVLFWFFFQGSYGVVKLAYNEDDNTYYVRQTRAD